MDLHAGWARLPQRFRRGFAPGLELGWRYAKFITYQRGHENPTSVGLCADRAWIGETVGASIFPTFYCLVDAWLMRCSSLIY